MPFYKYKGVDYDGKKIKGYELCDDEASLRVTLRNAGIYLESFKAVKEKRRSSFLSLSSKVSTAQFLSFCQQFSIMLKSGLTIKDCFENFRHQNFSTYFKNIISEVYEDVLKGVYLSEAFKKHKKVFPTYFCSMVYIGELTGNLADVLVKASAYYSNDVKVKRKIKSALIYPTFLFIVVVAIFFALMIVVVPSFKEMLESNGAELPGITKFVMGLSDFITGNLLIVFAVLIVLVVGGFFFFTSKPGKKFKSTMAMYLPMINTVKKNSMTSRFCAAFGILLQSGMQVLDCMKVMPSIIDDPYFNEHFKNVVSDLNHGRKLSRALEKVGIFPQMLIQMTAVGENSSALEEVYTTVGDYYNDVLNTSIARATGMLEPIVIVIMGGLVLFVLLAVMLPMFSLMQSF